MALVCFLGVFVVSFRDVLLGLHQKWVMLDGTYSHGYLVLALSVYFLYKNRQELSQAPVRPNVVFGLICVLGSLALWGVGQLTFIELLQQVAIPILIWSTVMLCAGWRFARVIIFPVFFLYFSIPVWDYLSPLLRIITAWVATQTVLAWGISAYIDGSQIHLPFGVMEIAEGCSGLKYALVGLIIGAFYSLEVPGWRGKLVAISVFLGLSIVANWVRVISLVGVAYYSKMQHPLVGDHDNFGWYIYASALCISFVVMPKVLVKLKLNQKKVRKISAGAQANSHDFRVSPLFLSLLLLTAIPAYVKHLNAKQITPNLVHFGNSAAPWGGDGWVPDFSGYDYVGEFKANTSVGDVYITVLTYFTQEQGKELVYYSNRIEKSRFERKLRPISIDADLELNRSVIEGDIFENGPLLILWGYLVDEKITTYRYWAKLKQIPVLIGGKHPPALITFRIYCGEDECEKGWHEKVVEDITPTIQELIDAISYEAV